MEDEGTTESQNLDLEQEAFSGIEESSQHLLCQEASSPKLSVTELSRELDSKSELVRKCSVLLLVDQIFVF